MWKYLFISFLFLFCLSCETPTERLNGYAVHGIDVSHHQSRINWQAVAADSIDFVFIKATEGVTFQDSIFCDNWEQISKTDIKRGAYHFFLPHISPQLQAEHFIDRVEMKTGDLPPVLDVETDDKVSHNEMIAAITVWLTAVEEHYKIRPIIYTNLKFHKKYIAKNFDDYPIWIARYSPYKPNLNYGQSWTFWQYGNRGSVQGIEGNVDLNVFYGDFLHLEEMTYLYNDASYSLLK